MRLGVVVPCFNEELVIEKCTCTLLALFDSLSGAGLVDEARVYFVDDGSTDATWQKVTELASREQRVSGLKLSRNCGHQNALLAGLFNAEGDAIVTMDADLQDDVRAMEEMVRRFLSGCDIVYGVRNNRAADTTFKRGTALAFYRLMKFMGVEIVFNHADYRLMSRRAIENLKEFGEVNLFLRGIIPLIGFKTDEVYYERLSRQYGESKYPLGKMMEFAFNGITSFSIAPLRFIMVMGFTIFAITLLVSLWAVWVKLFSGQSVPGWASTVLPLYLLGGAQIFCTGLIGEYLGKIYKEVKARPRFIIEKTV